MHKEDDAASTPAERRASLQHRTPTRDACNGGCIPRRFSNNNNNNNNNSVSPFSRLPSRSRRPLRAGHLAPLSVDDLRRHHTHSLEPPSTHASLSAPALPINNSKNSDSVSHKAGSPSSLKGSASGTNPRRGRSTSLLSFNHHHVDGCPPSLRTPRLPPLPLFSDVKRSSSTSSHADATLTHAEPTHVMGADVSVLSPTSPDAHHGDGLVDRFTPQRHSRGGLPTFYALQRSWSGCSNVHEDAHDGRTHAPFGRRSSPRRSSRSQHAQESEEIFVALNHRAPPMTITEVQNFHDFLLTGDAKSAAVRGDVDARTSGRSISSILISPTSSKSGSKHAIRRRKTPWLLDPSSSDAPSIQRGSNNNNNNNNTQQPQPTPATTPSSPRTRATMTRLCTFATEEMEKDDAPRHHPTSPSSVLISPRLAPLRSSPSLSSARSPRERSLSSRERLDDFLEMHHHPHKMPTTVAGVQQLHRYLNDGDRVAADPKHIISPRHRRASRRRRSSDARTPPPPFR